MISAAKPAEAREEQRLTLHYDAEPRLFTRWQRVQIRLIGWAGYWLVRVIGRSLRFEVLGSQNAESVYAASRQCILTFWHRAIFTGIWWWRHRGIVVLVSANFDGQWTKYVIERMGYATALGSSSRGGLKALAVMARRLEDGRDGAVTPDGPRGPRYVAKPGPVMLARRTGNPVVAFHIGLERAYTFGKSWDLAQVPHLFSRAVVAIAPPIYVSQDADREQMERKQAEMQAALERVRELTESWFTLSDQEREQRRVEWRAAPGPRA